MGNEMSTMHPNSLPASPEGTSSSIGSSGSRGQQFRRSPKSRRGPVRRPSRPRKHACTVCGKKFGAKCWLLRHMMVHGSAESTQFVEAAAEQALKAREAVRRVVICAECQNMVLEVDYASVHLELKHPGRSKDDVDMFEEWECKECKKRFGTAAGCRRHVTHLHLKSETRNREHVERVFSSILEKSEGSDSQTTQQEPKQIASRILSCSKCEVSLLSEADLPAHVEQNHHDAKRRDIVLVEEWKCTACNRQFASFGACQRHIAHGHETKQTASESNTDDVAPPEKVIRHTICSLCKADIEESDFENHIRSEHDGEGRTEVKLQESWECKSCQRRFPSCGGCKRHFAHIHSHGHSEVIHSASAEEDDVDDDDDVNVTRWILCSQCDATIIDDDAFDDHIQEFHANLSEKEVTLVEQWQCNFCERRFTTSGGCKRHINLSHIDELQKMPGSEKEGSVEDDACSSPASEEAYRCIFVCERCDVEVEEAQLKEHVREAHPKIKRASSIGLITRYKCGKCDRHFGSIGGCKRHLLRTHDISESNAESSEDESPELNDSDEPHPITVHVCSLCDAQLQPPSWNRHKRTQHAKEMRKGVELELVERSQCSECNVIYFNESNCKRHIRNVHQGVDVASGDESDDEARETKSASSSKYPEVSCCSICQRRVDETNWNTHVHEFHAGSEEASRISQFACPDCGHLYHCSSSVRRHMIKGGCPGPSQKPEVEATKEEFMDVSADVHEEHVISQPIAVLTCSACQQVVENESELKTHAVEKHSSSSRATVTPVVEHSFACPECDAIRSTRAECESHIRVCHGPYFFNLPTPQAAVPDRESEKDTDRRSLRVRLRCPKCVKLFRDVTHLELHIDDDHLPKIPRSARRIVPARSFARPSEHIGEPSPVSKTPKPAHAPKTPARPAEPRSKPVSPSPEFACVTCNKQYCRIAQLDAHVEKEHLGRVGAGPVCLACVQCNQTFVSMEELARHDSEVHFPGRLACPVCFRNYSHEFALQRHMKVHAEEGSAKRERDYSSVPSSTPSSPQNEATRWSKRKRRRVSVVLPGEIDDSMSQMRDRISPLVSSEGSTPRSFGVSPRHGSRLGSGSTFQVQRCGPNVGADDRRLVLKWFRSSRSRLCSKCGQTFPYGINLLSHLNNVHGIRQGGF